MAAQPAQAFASHLINQTLSSIALLESLALLNPSDASLIRQKLPSPTGPFPSLAPPSPSASFANLTVAQSPSSWAVQHRDDPSQQQPHSVASTPGPPTLPPRQRPPAEQRAKALWDFSGTQADDLQFRSGDILIIDEEVNDQWSRGRVIPNGHHAPLPRSGLFPSNYVEKIEPQLQQSHQPPQQIPYYQSSPAPGGMVPYQPPQQPYYDHKQPMHMMPPQQQMQGGVVVQQPEQNKGKFGKIGGPLGTAAVTGVGFGAGSAVGSGIINSIF
ncbi:hypothetical protein L198_05021 [Cryptococcus wingfieldii CBS 7118]|uniref:SH3 domain-containing protein n=1 Tax=Cryptococcus wingfieldii CBS 7118 TaxID=1295528 RepID=A0A1E3IZW3_9TREE|nr:hypothetical protein L198_05021 [Cryptococcus wingfieldii CBS 7118]ODN94170.1 hypothetical protein L198_05021 [Cryptococcus wingfieldii CBS 7118]